MPRVLKPIIFKKKDILKKDISSSLGGDLPLKKEMNVKINDFFKSSLVLKGGVKEGTELYKIINKLDVIDLHKHKDKKLKDIIEEKVKPGIGNNKELKAEYKEFMSNFTKSITVDRFAEMDKTVEEHPAFTIDVLDTNKFFLFKESVFGGDEDKISKVIEALNNPGSNSDPQLNYLVEKKIVTNDELSDIKFTLDLGVMTFNNTKLIGQLKGNKIKSLEDLIPYDEKKWIEFIEKNKIAVPDFIKGDNKKVLYARHMEEVIASVFPSKKIFYHITAIDENDVLNTLKNLEKFLKNNPKVVIEKKLPPKNKLIYDGINDAQKEKIKNDFKKLQKFNRKYIHIDLNKIINDRSKTVNQKINEIKNKIKIIDKFKLNNPDFDFQSADFNPERHYIKKVTDKKNADKLKINWDGIIKKDKHDLILQLKRYQRIYKIYPRYKVVSSLLEEGFGSAKEITSMTEKKFINDYKNKLGVDEKVVKKIYRIAKERENKNALVFTEINNTAGSRVYNPNPGPGLFNNLGQDVLNYIKNITGYQEIFGDLRFCDCPGWQSIFSPAAYFTDLFLFINENIPDNTLSERRPDLFDIKLTEENTFKLIPYTSLVNEIMEENIKKNEGDNDAYDVLMKALFPFDIPFNLHMERIRTFLEHFKISLYKIYDLFADDKENSDLQKKHIACEFLKISPQEYDVIVTKTDTEKEFKKRWGFDPDDNTVDLLDTLKKVKVFLKHSRLTRKEFNELIGTDLIKEDDRKKLFINCNENDFLYVIHVEENGEKKEELEKLSKAKVDILHRFIRLSEKINWSFKELDLVLKSIRAADITEKEINAISKIEKLRQKFKVPLESLVILWSDFNTSGHTKPETDNNFTFFEKIYKNIETCDEDYDFTKLTLKIGNYDDPDEKVKNGLLAALEISEAELFVLLKNLETKLGNADQKLISSKLSLLYRFSLIPKLLNISIREFFLLWNGICKMDQNISAIDYNEKIFIIMDWLKESNWSIYELHYILTKIENEFTDPGFVNDDLKNFLIEYKDEQDELEKILYIEDNDDPPENELKKNYVDENFNSLKENYPGIFGAAAGINDLSQEKINEIIDNERIAAKVKITVKKISQFFDLTPEIFEQIAKIVVKLDDEIFLDKLIKQYDKVTDVPDDLAVELKEIYLFKYLLVDKLKFNEKDIKRIIKKPAEFGVSDNNPLDINTDPLDINSIVNLSRYGELKTLFNDNLNIFLEYLEENNADKKAEKLSEITRWNYDDIKKLIKYFWNNNAAKYNGIPQVWKMKKCLDISKTAGVKVASIINVCKSLMKNNVIFKKYKEIADFLLEIAKAKYKKDEWAGIYKPLNKHISRMKRDALSSYITGIDNKRKLYEYILVDPEMSPCFEISRIKLGISSLQLYFQRCCMNQEKDTGGDSINIDEDLSKEWSWRKNYRVWEANRKVFLYPENYIYPELRDNKTPLFKELEDELFQEEITDIGVEKVFKNYLDKFVQLSNLITAGAYHDKNEDILYIIGRTKTDPYIFYSRKCLNYSNTEKPAIWKPWKKIDLAIKAPYVSPVFAFRRLFVFWVETHTEKRNEQEGKTMGESKFDKEVVKAAIKFSFFDLSGKWAQPQVLAQEVESNFTANNLTKIIYLIIKDDRIEVHTNKLKKYYILELNFNSSEKTTPILHAQSSAKFNVLRNNNNKIKLSSIEMFYDEKASNAINSLIQEGSEFDSEKNILNQVSEDTRVKIVNNNLNLFLIDTFNNSEYIAEFKNINSYSGNFIQTELEAVDFSESDVSLAAKSSIEINLLTGSPHNLMYDNTIFDSVEKEALTLGKIDKYARFISEYTVRFHRIDSQAANTLPAILFSDGIKRLLHTRIQYNLNEPDFDNLSPNKKYVPESTWPDFKIDYNGPYGIYYWELFFHAPFLIANTLNANQKFEDARKWYHYIFNPVEPLEKIDNEIVNDDNNDHYKFWRFLPFRNRGLDDLEEILTDGAAIEEYKENPFKPHAIARMRLNAYQKAIVMKYVDNLLDWGDNLFTRDTIESINEAANLYIIAYDLLGKKPEKLEACPQHKSLSYKEIIENIDTDDEYIDDFYIQLENSYLNDSADIIDADDEGMSFNNTLLKFPYFCVPENKLFLKYWDRVEDRLYKIRNCMNIKGIVRQLPLFQPPIDPMALVKAAASGRDISSVISEILSGFVSNPYYRFTYMIEKAKSLVSTTQQLGSSLLSALEKKDAEELSITRSLHEKAVLKLTTSLKENQLKEVEENITALGISRESAVERNSHYKKLVKEGLIKEEQAQLASMYLSWIYDTTSNIYSIIGSVLHLIPNLGAPTAITYGGKQLGESIRAMGDAYRAMSSFHSHSSNISSTLAGFSRRMTDWKLQESQTLKEINNIDSQILSATIRKSVIEKEIEIHEKNTEQNDEINFILKNKFTNKDLYKWMSTQISTLYFQTYKLAYDFAKKAEQAFQFETGSNDTFINYGHWDSLKKGLLSGERLALELNRLETAFINQNQRDQEIEKVISLRLLDPQALYDLKRNGICTFNLDEYFFDLDFPGHYFRKIKNISISIPAVVGPYQNIKAALTQTGYQILKNPIENGVKYLLGIDGINLSDVVQDVVENYSSSNFIAISKGVNDTGMFELNFRDNRYLPFEGTGAVSSWKLEMSKASNQIDFDSISDIIINLRYTAKFDGGLRDQIITYDKMKKISGNCILSLKHDFSTEWYGFINPEPGNEKFKMRLNLTDKMFPPNVKNINLKENVFLKLNLPDELYDKKKLNIASDFAINFTINRHGGVPLKKEFKFDDTTLDIISKGVSMELNKISDIELTIERAGQNIPAKLRMKNEDNTDKIEIINGNNWYFIDSDKLKNIGLVLEFEADLIWE